MKRSIITFFGVILISIAYSFVANYDNDISVTEILVQWKHLILAIIITTGDILYQYFRYKDNTI